MNHVSNLSRLLGGLLLISVITVSLALPISNETDAQVNGKTNNATKVISLAQSIRKSQLKWSRDDRALAMQQYWKETFEEIKNLAVNFPETPSGTTNRNPLTQWKSFLEENTVKATLDENTTKARPRFEGFASWERKLQQWNDEVQEYVERIRAETGEYPFSTYGIPSYRNATETPPETSPTEDLQMVPGTKMERPVPAPAQPAEPVVPHTDIADKSKRILIVTTAALPWMTGTAVNPLLRSAYLTKGRAKQGGRVTLMLPWLERMSDQERVYGKAKSFQTQDEQEQHIRTWLRDTAGMADASKELEIIWYTAWLERAENSIYSMGDITALVSAEDHDICILEEPEHLNWYRAPGESWTAKFDHVVGIIHTNYFAYAQEQPAALIRVSMHVQCGRKR